MPDSSGHLGAVLSDRYTIERELGRGGNAVVYLAHDTKHDRKVALKVLTPELALTVRTERFFREIQISARLNHPHILTLIDSGQAGESLFYVMPYVEGESLRDRLNRAKQLPLEEALSITRDVAAALGYAHAQGVVHRDIKPENILLHQGHAVVMDFGIARALVVAGEQAVTEGGIAVGTPAYMSPEQASGSSAVDPRSDIYSLGCVLYEMLAGRPPFTGGTAQEILSRHALDSVPVLRAARPNIPPEIERVVGKTLAKAPADRFATAGDLMGALRVPAPGVRRLRRWPVAAAVAVLVLMVVVLTARDFLRARAAPADYSLAVLPFDPLSTDSTQKYFSDGLTEELINTLVRLPGLRVPGRTSSFVFKDRHNLTLRQIGDSLRVANVLEGSVRRQRNRFRITAQLRRVADDFRLWSETYDREVTDTQDLLAVQEDIAMSIVRALRIPLSAASRAFLARHPTEDPVAYELYVNGRSRIGDVGSGTAEVFEQATDYLQAAIDRDSTFALAYAGLARAYNSALVLRYVPLDSALRVAEWAANKAVALDSMLPEGHIALGRVRALKWDWKGSELAHQRAIELGPGLAEAHLTYGQILMNRGRFQDAVNELRTAQRLDPLSSPAVLARTYLGARDFDQAIQQAANAVKLDSTSINARQYLGEAYFSKGMYAEAISEFEKLLNQLQGQGRVAQVLARLGCSYARAGKPAEARRTLARLRERSGDAGYAYSIALLYGELGERGRAFDMLEQAFKERDFGLANNIGWLAFFDPLRGNSQFDDLVKRIGVGTRS